MNKKIALLILFFVILATQAFAKEFTLEAAIERALYVNPTIQEKMFAIKKAKMDIGVAQSAFWPTVALTSTNMHLKNHGGAGSVDDLSQTSSSHGVRVSLSLFSGFIHYNQIKKTVIRHKISELIENQAMLEVVVNVKIHFFSLLKEQRNLKFIKGSIQRIEKQLASARAFSNKGMAPYVNVLQNEVELAQANERLIQTENTIRTHKIMLNHYLQIPSDVDVLYIGNLEKVTFGKTLNEKEALAIAEDKRPDLAIAKLSIQEAKKQSKIILGDALPKIDLTYDNMLYSRQYSDNMYQDYDRKYWAVGINFTWPIFEGGKTTFEYKGERNRIRSLQKAYENAASTAKTEVIKAYLDTLSAKEILKTSRTRVKAAQEAYAQAKVRYDKLFGTITELLDAQTSLTEAEVSMSQAIANYQIADAKFQFYMGKK